jgi:alkanesulfonate monooxygenase SsuD/methylene tetrahydromethanopterin reductase-like flavin-dependent oxidoreductase (luciferase family)
MRILFDQATPVQIRKSLQDHIVITAEQQGWSRFSNGQLLRAAEDAGFDVLVTPDQNLPHQQNLAGWKIAVVVLEKANWPLIRLALPEVVAAILAAKPGSFTLVSIPGH